MDELKDYLHPSNDSHSVKEAVISLFFDKPIQKPESFESLLKNGLSKYFDSFDTENQVQFQLSNKIEELSKNQPQVKKDVGFRFSNIKNGKVANVLQARNEINRQFISYHTLAYDDWDIFFQDFLDISKNIGKVQPELCVQAFSLHYIDEFNWSKDIKIDLQKIFREESNYLSKAFFKSKLVNYNLTTINENPEYFDRLDISRSELKNCVLSISHNLTRKLEYSSPLTELLEGKLLTEVLEDAHDKNKKLLLDMLTKEVCELIKLKP